MRGRRSGDSSLVRSGEGSAMVARPWKEKRVISIKNISVPVDLIFQSGMSDPLSFADRPNEGCQHSPNRKRIRTERLGKAESGAFEFLAPRRGRNCCLL